MNKNIDNIEIKEYEYLFGSYNNIKITIICYTDINIEPYIKIYKNEEYFCRLSLIHSKYIDLNNDILLNYDDINNIYTIIKDSPYNIFAMFAHTIEENLNPYLSDDEKNNILEQQYYISNRNFENFKLPNYYSLLVYNLTNNDDIFGQYKLNIINY